MRVELAEGPHSSPRALADGWWGGVQAQVEERLAALLDIPDEAALDGRWAQVWPQVRAYAQRPAKRLRPALVVAGYALARGGAQPPEGLWQFAAGQELLHTFLLIHDDVADRAELRRGGPSLHRLLSEDPRLGGDLAVVAGDHLFARSLEVMLGAGLPRAPEAVRYLLGICRHTAVGQFLDLDLGRTPLREVTLWQTLKVAHLKTARYGFVAPLVTGARLGGADTALCETLERLGRHLGTAFQLEDDLLGLYGDPRQSGKSADSDLTEGKRTFPLVAAYLRAPAHGRAELERLAEPGPKGAPDLERARALIEQHGGKAATRRAIERHTRSAQRSLLQLPASGGIRGVLEALLHRLMKRKA